MPTLPLRPSKRSYHHTAPISACYAIHEALRLVLEEGIESRIERHRRNYGVLRDALEDLGFAFLVDPAFRLPMLNAVVLPAGLDDATTRRILLDEFDIEVGAGLGPLAGKIWRIGLMDESSTVNHIHMLSGALRSVP